MVNEKPGRFAPEPVVEEARLTSRTSLDGYGANDIPFPPSGFESRVTHSVARRYTVTAVVNVIIANKYLKLICICQIL